MQQQYPNTNEGRDIDIDIVPLRDIAEDVTNHFVVMLLGAAIFVFLLACANIGNLQLARAAGREKEFAVRTALGGSRARIARQMLAESVLISIAAGFVGLALASWDTDFMRASIPAIALRFVPGLRATGVTPNVVLYTFVVSMIAGVLCSLPAIAQAAPGKMRANLNDALRGRGGTGTSPTRNRMRRALVVSELALALTLLVGAGLMVQTFNRMLEINQGFDPKNLLTMQVSLPASDYKEAAKITGL